MDDERIVRGATATLTVVLADDNGDPIVLADDASVLVRVVSDVDSAVLVGDEDDPVPAVDLDGGVWGADVPAQTLLGTLTATWGVGDSTVTTTAEVVGARIFSAAELRASDPSLADATKVTAADITAVTAEVEDEFARICGCSFIPRGVVETLPGGVRQIVLGWPFVRLVSVTDHDVAVDASATLAGVLTRSNGAYWRAGRHVRAVYEHGWPAVPADVRRAALLRARHRVNSVRSGVPDRATSFASSDGGTFTLTTAGRGGSETGIPDVDAVLRRYDMRAAS